MRIATLIMRLGLIVLSGSTLLIVLMLVLGRALHANEIAFDSRRSGHNEIYVLDLERGITLPLTRGQTDYWSPAWSPDGTQLLFSSLTKDNGAVYVMNANGGTPRHLINNTSVGNMPVAWSPDGQKIAFTSVVEGRQGLYLLDLASGTLKALTTGTVNAFSPTWSPDGAQIAFSWSPVANQEIYVLDVARAVELVADRSQLHKLTNDPALDTSPAWSPDGQWIAFATIRDNNTEIYLMDTQGENLQRLTHNLAADTNPSWSPDGQYILFVSNRDGNTELYMMARDGSNPQRLTYNPTEDLHPVWRP